MVLKAGNLEHANIEFQRKVDRHLIKGRAKENQGPLVSTLHDRSMAFAGGIRLLVKITKIIAYSKGIETLISKLSPQTTKLIVTAAMFCT